MEYSEGLVCKVFDLVLLSVLLYFVWIIML